MTQIFESLGEADGLLDQSELNIYSKRAMIDLMEGSMWRSILSGLDTAEVGLSTVANVLTRPLPLDSLHHVIQKSLRRYK